MVGIGGGTGYEVAVDGGGSPQNNAVFVFTLAEGSWFVQDHLKPTCWTVIDSSNVILGGDKPFKINQYDNTEVYSTFDDGYECGQATSGGASTLNKTGAGWTPDALIDLYIYHYSNSHNSGESKIITDNDETSITADFTYDPVADDFYAIIPGQTANSMTFVLTSPEYVLGSYTDVKELFNGFIRCSGYGSLSIAYSWTNGVSGSIDIDLTDDDVPLWGVAYYWEDGAVEPAAGGLTFSTIDNVMKTFNFPQNKGEHLTINMTMTTDLAFTTDLISLGWRLRTNTWKP